MSLFLGLVIANAQRIFQKVTNQEITNQEITNQKSVSQKSVSQNLICMNDGSIYE